jgi:hypothetical protein
MVLPAAYMPFVSETGCGRLFHVIPRKFFRNRCMPRVRYPGFRSGSLRTEKMQKDTEKAQRYFTDGHGFAQRDSYINLEMDSGV